LGFESTLLGPCNDSSQIMIDPQENIVVARAFSTT